MIEVAEKNKDKVTISNVFDIAKKQTENEEGEKEDGSSESEVEESSENEAEEVDIKI
jgi:hypothetical protein